MSENGEARAQELEDMEEIDSNDFATFEDFKLSFDEDGQPKPVHAETKFGVIIFHPFQYADEVEFGLWGREQQDLIQKPLEEWLKIFRKKIIKPDFSEITLEDLRSWPGDSIYELQMVLLWRGGVFGRDPELEVDIKNNRIFRKRSADANSNTPSTSSDTDTEETKTSTPSPSEKSANS